MMYKVFFAIIFCFIFNKLLAADINTIDWRMHQYDASHKGFVNVTLDTKKFNFAWKSPTGEIAPDGMGYIISQAVTTKNMVFVSRNNGQASNTLQAFSLSNGNEIWKKSYYNGEVQLPATDSNIVYLQTKNYDFIYINFYGYDADSGEEIFQSWVNGHSYLSPTIYESNIYVNGLYSLNKFTGEENWYASIGRNTVGHNFGRWTAAVNEQFTIGYSGGNVEVFDRESGQWLFDISNPNYDWFFFGSPAMIDDDTVAIIESGYLMLFSLNEKDVKSVGPGYVGFPASNGELIYASKNGGLVVIDKNDMREKWRWFKHDEYVNSQLILTENVVLLTTDKKTYAIDLTTHKELWHYPETGLLSLGRGYLFISSHDGMLHAIKVK